MTVITIRVVCGADSLKAEALMLKGMCMSHMRASC